MPTDTNLNQLVINKLTKEQYKTASETGGINETELYLITDDEGGGDAFNQGVENAGKFWKVGPDGGLIFENPVAKFSNGPVIIETTQTLDLTKYGLKVGDQINVVCVGGGGGGGGCNSSSTYGTAKGGDGGKGGATNGGGGGGGYGAGGGGSGFLNSTSASNGAGSGGGGGYLAAGTITLAETAVAITVGAAGTGVADYGTAGSGGTTSFGSYLSAEGGQGGRSHGVNNGTYGLGGHKGGDCGLGSGYKGGGGGGGGWVIDSATVYSGSEGTTGIVGVNNSTTSKGGTGGTNGGAGGVNGGAGADSGVGHGVVVFWY